MIPPTALNDIPSGQDSVVEVLEYAYQRFEISGFDIYNTSPLWVRDVLRVFYDTLAGANGSCDVLFLANDKQPTTSLILAIASSMGTVTILELANLAPHHLMGRANYIGELFSASILSYSYYS